MADGLLLPLLLLLNLLVAVGGAPGVGIRHCFRFGPATPLCTLSSCDDSATAADGNPAAGEDAFAELADDSPTAGNEGFAAAGNEDFKQLHEATNACVKTWTPEILKCIGGVFV